MSLLKQLLLSVTVAIVIIVVGTLAFSIGSARNYLNAQVQSESENAAVSLAITLSQPANQDPVIRELLMMALYDTGRFQAVSFAQPDGKVVFERTRAASTTAQAGPAWFRSILPLETPVSTKEVTDGWKQAGQLTIVGDNGYAYVSLWQNALRQLTLVLIAGLLWAFVVMLLMRWLRRALDEQVASQVRAIGQGEDLPPSTHAAVRELNELVSEISHVRERVRANVHEMDAKIEQLNVELHQDEVTGLANRRYFINELRRVLQDENAVPGHVMLVRMRDLAAVNTAHDRHEVDAWLREAANEMQEIAAGQHMDAQVARLNGSDFAILIPGLNGPQATRFARAISGQLRDLSLGLPNGGYSRWAFSLTDYAPGRDAGSVMSLLDHGLMRAESAGRADVEYLPSENSNSSRMGASESEWRTLLRTALDDDGFRLQVNRVRYDGALSIERSDASLQVRDGNEWLPGSLFMPVATRLNLSTECDIRTLDLAIEWIKTNRRELAIRVSLASLTQSRFWPELRVRLETLEAQPELARYLAFELDAHGLVACPEEVALFCQAAKAASLHVGLRRLDAEPAALAQLHAASVDYVRLTGSLIDGLADSVGGTELLRAIATTARRLNLSLFSDVPGSDADAVVLRAHDVSVAMR